jgi:predicted TIM-barrel fold metal-dependent hydrolase
VDEVVPELQWAGARAHNRWLAEFCQMAPERRAGVAIVPALWDVAEAVREVEWARANGLRSALLPCYWGKQPSYQDPRYDPLWAACQDQEVVVNFHSGGAPMADYGAGRGMVGIYISEVAWWTARPLAFLVWSGVFERFPRLRVAVTEGTCVWAPELKTLLDFRYEETHFAAKLGDYRSHLSMKPSEYFARNVFYGASCMPRREADLRHEIGLGNIMWGSDYPHPEGTWPGTAASLHATFDGLPEDELAAILGGNAARVYGFDLEKLAPLAARIGPGKSSFAKEVR